MNDFFPHETVRPVQQDFMNLVAAACAKKKNLIVHAPTGLGKTAASLAPALQYALENDKVVFFLTSRHTQHKIAIETLQQIKTKHTLSFDVVDIIGKKWMCLVPGASTLNAHEFQEYCKAVRKDNKCIFYTNTKGSDGKYTVEAKNALHTVRNIPLDKMIDVCKDEKMCPYEMSILISQKAKVVVADYYYIFNPKIRNMILGKMNKSISDVIVVVDEAHNLPFRIRDLMTSKTSIAILKRAISEAVKYDYNEEAKTLEKIVTGLEALADDLGLHEEKLITKKDIMSIVEHATPHTGAFIENLESCADMIREAQKSSFMGSVEMFLTEWQGADEGYARILGRREGMGAQNIVASYRCLDPSLISREVIGESHCSILMSGTLTPTDMYRDLLGVVEPMTAVFESPFPKENKCNLVVPITTTKFTQRSDDQFKNIAEICANITNTVPGNTAIFFPSYAIRDKVAYHFTMKSTKSQIQEEPGMTKQDKLGILDKLEEYKSGAGMVLLGVSSGSFGEGVDFPGDLLKGVIVVGLPLRSPDLETKQLIDYFDLKFGKGWNYGYVFPAFNKTLQNAGRCIRSATDKGVVVFLDERYAWPRYFNCFPNDQDIKVTKEYLEEISSFFDVDASSQKTLFNDAEEEFI